MPLSHWSSQLFDLRAPSSTDVPVLLLNQRSMRVKTDLLWRRGRCPSSVNTVHNLGSLFLNTNALYSSLISTARRRVANTRGASSHSLQTLSTSDSTHSLSNDRYGRTSGSLNPQQSLSRQPQASSSVPYIAHGNYSSYGVNGDIPDSNR